MDLSNTNQDEVDSILRRFGDVKKWIKFEGSIKKRGRPKSIQDRLSVTKGRKAPRFTALERSGRRALSVESNNKMLAHKEDIPSEVIKEFQLRVQELLKNSE